MFRVCPLLGRLVVFLLKQVVFELHPGADKCDIPVLLSESLKVLCYNLELILYIVVAR